MFWRTILGLPLYKASDTGLIRSKARSVRAHLGMRKVMPGRILEPRHQSGISDAQSEPAALIPRPRQERKESHH